MWLLHFIPDSLIVMVINFILLGGIGLTVGSLFMGFIPFIKLYKFPIEAIGIALLVVGAYLKGGFGAGAEMREQVKALEAKIAIAEEKSKTANAQVQTKIITKIVKIQDKANTAKESLRRNKDTINAECKLTDDAINSYNFSITKTPTTPPAETK
jgi:hypothetical protein